MNALRQRAKLTGTVVAFAVAAVVTFGVTGALHARVSASEATDTRTPMPVISEMFITEAGYERQQKFLGLVQAASRSQVGFEVPGAIDKILVSEGQTVEAGQALAILNAEALQARRRAAASTVEQVSAELELARARTERQAPLRNTGAISAQTFDDTRLAEKSLASSLEAAKAQLEALEIDLAKTTLRAPYSARIGRQLVDRGAVTAPGTPVFTLVSTADREAHIGIAVEQASDLTPGESYTLQWREEFVDVKLRAVRPDVNPISMTTVAIFELPAELAAFDGEPVSVIVPRRVAEPGGWLPLSALLEGERGVWTVLALSERDGMQVSRREVVEVLHVSGTHAFVRGTLNAGDEVIADGIHRIAPGTLVTTLNADQQRLARN